MNEEGFRIFHEAFPAGAELLYALGLTLFLRPFLVKRGQRRHKLLIVFLLYLAGRLVCDWITVPQGVFGLFLLLLLVAVSGRLGLDRRMAFLLLLLFWNARISSGLVVESLYDIVQWLLPYPASSLEAIYSHTIFFVMLFLFSHVALLFAMLYVLQRQMMKQRMSMHYRELCYVSLIPTAGILFGQMISGLLFEFQDGVLLRLYERHPAFLAVVPLLALLFYLGVYMTITFWQGMTALREEQAACFVERQQTQAIQARIHETEQIYTQIRKLKHEMRGHLNNIKGLAHNGDYVSLEEYIAQMDKNMGDFELTFQTGNPVTDVIVNDARQQCRNLRIRFQTEFYYPESAGYDAFDMGIILQNLLQNALEACEKMAEGERFITLKGRRRGRFFLIEVKNSFSGKVVFGQDGLPVTTKREDTFMHGIGLSNVRQEAEKYKGELELKADTQEFYATVLLQERGIYE